MSPPRISTYNILWMSWSYVRPLSRQGKTIIVATHDFNLVTRYASRLVLLQAGKLIAQGNQETVLNPEAIQEVFQVDAEIVPTKAGPPVYVFHQRSAS